MRENFEDPLPHPTPLISMDSFPPATFETQREWERRQRLKKILNLYLGLLGLASLGWSQLG